MDIQMPGFDGFSTTEKIRKELGLLKDIPIIAMTAHGMKEDMEKCLTVRMNDYVNKPFKPNELYLSPQVDSPWHGGLIRPLNSIAV